MTSPPTSIHSPDLYRGDPAAEIAEPDHERPSDLQHRDNLLTFIDRGRLQARFEEAVSRIATPVAARSYSREELVLRLDWSRLQELFAHALTDEVRTATYAVRDYYTEPLRAAELLHDAVTGPDGRTVCAVEPGQLYPCHTTLELNAARGLAWRGDMAWEPFTAAEAAASQQAFHCTALYWRPGIGADPNHDQPDEPNSAGRAASTQPG